MCILCTGSFISLISTLLTGKKKQNPHVCGFSSNMLFKLGLFSKPVEGFSAYRTSPSADRRQYPPLSKEALISNRTSLIVLLKPCLRSELANLLP